MELIILAVGILLGWKMGTFFQAVSFKQILDDLGVKESQLRSLAQDKGIDLPKPEAKEPDLHVVEVRVEEIDGVYFVYRKVDDQFLCQGTDRQQLIDGIHSRIGNCRVIVDRDEGAEFFKA